MPKSAQVRWWINRSNYTANRDGKTEKNHNLITWNECFFSMCLIRMRVSSLGIEVITWATSSSVTSTRWQLSSSLGREHCPCFVTQGSSCEYRNVNHHILFGISKFLQTFISGNVIRRAGSLMSIFLISVLSVSDVRGTWGNSTGWCRILE